MPVSLMLLLGMAGTVSLCAASLCAQEKATGVLLVKPGDAAATPKQAASFLASFASYLGQHVPGFQGTRVRAHITNKEADAVQILAKARPRLAIVPAGFYLKHLRGPKQPGIVVAEVPRFGSKVEHYYVLARKKGGPASLAALRGKRVRTTSAIDWSYLRRVVFPKGSEPGRYFVLEPSSNLADDVFLMTEGGADEKPPDALLVDEELKRFFQDDDLVWPELKVIWSSPALPRDLVVLLGKGWQADRPGQEKLRQALVEMKENKDGKKLLSLMRSDGFAAPDHKLLATTAQAYDIARKQEQEKEKRKEKGKRKGEGKGKGKGNGKGNGKGKDHENQERKGSR